MTTTDLQDQAMKLLKQEGTKGWNKAKRELEAQKTSSKRLKEALNYITELPDYFRPALVSLCCEAVGGKKQDTIPCGAALIFFGKSLGIHDDIIDDTKKRKNRETPYGKFGEKTALVLSDVLVFKGFTLFKENFRIGILDQKLIEILETIEKVWFEQAEGEIFEIESRKSELVSPKQCLSKITKRASEAEAVCRIGAILGCGEPTQISTLGRYGRMIGTASLLRDELIDMLEFDTLKNRLLKESLPLPVIYVLENSEAKAQLEPLLGKQPTTIEDLQKISRITNEASGLSFVANKINTLMKEACLCAQGFCTEEKLKVLADSLCISEADWRGSVQF